MSYNLITSKARRYLSIFNRFSSQSYWDKRYKTGGNSGPSSHGPLAIFKAEALNEFVSEHNIRSIIEFGCGDGSQLALAKYPKYTGYDVSLTALNICRGLFQSDFTKEFFLISEYDNRKADLTTSLDVIFHLTEDHIFSNYMEQLFNASSRFVVIYSSDQDSPIEPVSQHVRHRCFSNWIQSHKPEWRLLKKIHNPYPYNGDSSTTSFADFYIYGKV